MLSRKGKRTNKGAIMTQEGDSRTSSYWKSLRSEMNTRFRTPFEHPPFIFYFLGSFVILGGMGIWVSLFSAQSFNPKSVGTYLLALTGTTTATLFLDDKLGTKSLRALIWLLTLVAGGCGLICLAGSNALVSVPGVGLAWLNWWLLNATDPKLRDSVPDPKATTGGDATGPLQGNLEGLRV